MKIKSKNLSVAAGGLIITVLMLSILAITGCDEGMQMTNGVVTEPTEPTTNGEVKQPEEPTEPVEPEPEPITMVTLPPGYELPPELIPASPPTLSVNEAALIEAVEKVVQKYPEENVVAPNLQTQAGYTADLISLLPYKEREEVYDLFVASVNLPSFAKAAEKTRDIDIQLIILNGEATESGNWDLYWNYSRKTSVEQGFLGQGNLNTLADIYFEENPKDILFEAGHSYYWIILEYYRLQLENPDLQNLYEKNNPAELLKLFRQSCKKGYVFGLDNPWN